MDAIHRTAVVPSDAVLGSGCSIGAYSVIESGAHIGTECMIGPHVCIGPKVLMRERVQVFPGASLGLLPQVRPQPKRPGGLDIGADTVIRESVTINAASSAGENTCIGARCLLMAYAHVGHDCRVGDDVTLVNGATLGGYVEIEHHATISAMVPVHQYSRIGAYSYVGGGYRVVQDVPPYLLAAGEPLKPHGLNTVGLRRNGFTEDQMRRLKAIYRHFYRSGLNFAQALARIDELEPCEERDHFASFIEKSERGVIR